MKRLIGVASLILVYVLLTSFKILPDPPFVLAKYVLNFIWSYEFIKIIRVDLLSTLFLTLVSWLLGTFIGIAFGVLVAMINKNSIIISMLEFLRSIPSVMWIPFGIVLVGLGSRPSIMVSSFIVFLLMASEIGYSGHLFLESRRLHFKRLGLSIWDRIRFIHIYEVLSTAVPTSRIALSISLVVIIIVEMQAGSQHGLGAQLLVFQGSQRGDAMVSVMLLAGLAGLTLNGVSENIENRLLPWLKLYKDIL